MGRCLNIAFIVNDFPCVSETFILNQITGLLELGNKVRIFAYEKVNDLQKQHAEVSKYDLLNKTEYFAPIPQKRPARALKFLRILSRLAIRRPAWISRCLQFKKYGVYESLNHLFLLEPFMRENYDIIHCQYGTIGKNFIYLKEIMDTKIFTSFRGYDLTRFVKENGPSVYEELFKRGDAFLPVCDYFARRLRELGCPPERIHIHYSGIDTTKFAFRDRQIDDRGIKILTVGRLTEKKGLEYSIRAVARLVARYPAIPYIIAGEGPLRPQLEDLICKLGMEKHVHLAGSLPAEEIKELLNNAHIFVLASVTAESGDQEGIPGSLKEAMATGLPVIATRHSGIPELVQDGVSGFLIPERDVDALAGKCEYLISHPQRRAEMGRAGRKFVEENFEISKLNRELVELYTRSLETLDGAPRAKARGTRFTPTRP